jgi:predicted dehydrogenase
MMAEFNVGLVGLGEISCYFINAVQQHPRMKMVAVCRRTPQPGDLEKYKDFKFYTDWKELVEDPDVNCIIIATPPSTHAPITQHALSKPPTVLLLPAELKKRVISEKPFSLTLEEAHHCIGLAKENKTHLNFAYHAAMNPLSLIAKERIYGLVQKGDKIVDIKVIALLLNLSFRLCIKSTYRTIMTGNRGSLTLPFPVVAFLLTVVLMLFLSFSTCAVKLSRLL